MQASGWVVGDKTAIEAEEGTPVPQLVESKNRLSANGFDLPSDSTKLSGSASVVPALPSAATEGLGFGDKISADHGPRPLVALLSVLLCVVAGRSAWSWYVTKAANRNLEPAASTSTVLA